MTIPRIAVTCGEPAGIGPDIILQQALQEWPAQLVVLADPALLAQRAALLDLTLEIEAFDAAAEPAVHRPGHLPVIAVPLAKPCIPGTLDTANAPAVVESLRLAAEGCIQGQFDAIVTPPVQKSIINEAGIPFSGHTEYFADITGTDQVVMMLASEQLRVALATTHLPLSAVPAAITRELLSSTLHILHRELQHKFRIPEPRIAVLGLNPHAGEGGHLGQEEINIITPTLKSLRQQGMNLLGPLPADTAFNPPVLANCDAVFAMYHDQGLPVLKYAGFGRAVNITLGLPLVRTSVDHGTALDLAGSGKADAGSLASALQMAIDLAPKEETRQ